MKNLNAFLNPKRKENFKFILSEAFVGEDGKPIEWEMRQLSAAESLEISKAFAHAESAGEIIAATIAQSLVVPNLRDKDLLDALSKREGRTILKPVDALKVLVSDPEYAKLASSYFAYNELGHSFGEQVEEAKN